MDKEMKLFYIRLVIILFLVFFIPFAIYKQLYIYFTDKWQGINKNMHVYLDDLNAYQKYPEYNYEREIMDRIYGSENGMHEATEKCYMDFDLVDDSGINLSVYQYDYGKIYKEGLQKANNEIKKKKVKSKKEKNEILNKYLIAESKEVFENNERNYVHLYKKQALQEPLSRTRGYYSSPYDYYIAPPDERGDKINRNIHYAIMGGLHEAIEKNPCDYLILKGKYKIEKDMNKIFYGYVDMLAKEKGIKYENAKLIVNVMDKCGNSFINGDLHQIIKPTYVVNREDKTIKVNFNPYPYGSMYTDVLSGIRKDKDAGKSVFKLNKGKNKAKEECEYYYRLKKKFEPSGKGRTYGVNEWWDYNRNEVDYVVTFKYEEQKDKNGESHFSLKKEKWMKEKIYNCILGGLPESMIGTSDKYYNKHHLEIFEDFDKQLDFYVESLKKSDDFKFSKTFIENVYIAMNPKNKNINNDNNLIFENFEKIDHLIIPSYILNEKEHKVSVRINPYDWGYFYHYAISHMDQEYQKGDSEINEKEKEEEARLALSWCGSLHDREESGLLTLSYEEVYDSKGEKHYKLIITEKDKNKLYKMILGNLPQMMKEEPRDYFDFLKKEKHIEKQY